MKKKYIYILRLKILLTSPERFFNDFYHILRTEYQMIEIGYNQPNEAPLETHFRRISSEIDHFQNRMSNMSSVNTANLQSHWNHELFQLSQGEGK